MNTVYFLAYKQCNLGDDLFIRAVLQRYPNVMFYMRGDQTIADRFRSEKNLHILSVNSRLISMAGKIRPSLAAYIGSLREKCCDALVYIGGSLFIEYQNWETILSWWRYAAEHRKFYVLGANFGPWHTEEYRRQSGEIFSKMQDVCFRDRYSQKLFSEIPTVRYAPDILLGYPMPKVEINSKQVFISVINCEAKDEGDNQLNPFDQAYTEGIANLAQRFIDQEWTVVLSSFCKAEGDEEGVKKIIDRVSDLSSVKTINYDGFNTEEILNTISASAIVYGTRFHAVVLGFAARRPVVPLIYSDKTNNILRDMQFSGESFDIRKMDQDFAERAFTISERPEHQLLSDIDRYAEQSTEHFLKLDALLK